MNFFLSYRHETHAQLDEMVTAQNTKDTANTVTLRSPPPSIVAFPGKGIKKVQWLLVSSLDTERECEGEGMNVPNLKDRPCLGEQDPPDQLITICSSDLTHVQTEKRNKVFARTAKRKGKGKGRERERERIPSRFLFVSSSALPYCASPREREREDVRCSLFISLSLSLLPLREREERNWCAAAGITTVSL